MNEFCTTNTSEITEWLQKFRLKITRVGNYQKPSGCFSIRRKKSDKQLCLVYTEKRRENREVWFWPITGRQICTSFRQNIVQFPVIAKMALFGEKCHTAAEKLINTVLMGNKNQGFQARAHLIKPTFITFVSSQDMSWTSHNCVPALGVGEELLAETSQELCIPLLGSPWVVSLKTQQIKQFESFFGGVLSLKSRHLLHQQTMKCI